jgi:hypothetical protein
MVRGEGWRQRGRKTNLDRECMNPPTHTHPTPKTPAPTIPLARPQTKQPPPQDNLAMAAIRFLTTVSKSVHHGLFGEPTALQQICESIIVPNLRVRPEDEEVGGSSLWIRWALFFARCPALRWVACVVGCVCLPVLGRAGLTAAATATLIAAGTAPAANRARGCTRPQV